MTTTFRNVIETSVSVDGDLINATPTPTPAETMTFRNTVVVGDTETGGDGDRRKFRNKVLVTSGLSRGETRVFANRVGVGEQAINLIDGRIEIMTTGRYRR